MAVIDLRLIRANQVAKRPERLVIRAARSATDFAGVYELRWRVFGQEQGLLDGTPNDPEDVGALNALALTGDVLRPVGIGRLLWPAPGRPEGIIAWVATAPGQRGRGVGTAVMHFLLRAADDAGVPVVLLTAQTHALAFYRRLGFRPSGQRFVIAGIEHVPMARRCP